MKRPANRSRYRGLLGLAALLSLNHAATFPQPYPGSAAAKCHRSIDSGLALRGPRAHLGKPAPPSPPPAGWVAGAAVRSRTMRAGRSFQWTISSHTTWCARPNKSFVGVAPIQELCGCGDFGCVFAIAAFGAQVHHHHHYHHYYDHPHRHLITTTIKPSSSHLQHIAPTSSWGCPCRRGRSLLWRRGQS